jgi:hypothetical protein
MEQETKSLMFIGGPKSGDTIILKKNINKIYFPILKPVKLYENLNDKELMTKDYEKLIYEIRKYQSRNNIIFEFLVLNILSPTEASRELYKLNIIDEDGYVR